MKIRICVGSTCHLLGSKRVADRFKELVAENNLDIQVDLTGEFCMGKCGEGVSVSIDGNVFSIKPEDTDEFFKNEVLAKL